MAMFEDTLRKLSLHDDGYIDPLLSDDAANQDASKLDAKTHALVTIAGLAAVDAAPASYLDAVGKALERRATPEEIAGCLIAVLPTVGAARAVSAAPKIALALGYDVDAALEQRGDRGTTT